MGQGRRWVTELRMYGAAFYVTGVVQDEICATG